VPRDLVFGPPAGEARPQGPLNPGGDNARPMLSASVRRRIGRRELLRDGLKVEVLVREAARVDVVHDTHGLAHVAGKGGSTDRPKTVVLDRAHARLERPGGKVKLRLRPHGRARRRLEGVKGAVATRLLISVVDAAGNERIVTERVEVGRG
jgi:hypothetical protein